MSEADFLRLSVNFGRLDWTVRQEALKPFDDFVDYGLISVGSVGFDFPDRYIDSPFLPYCEPRSVASRLDPVSQAGSSGQIVFNREEESSIRILGIFDDPKLDPCHLDESSGSERSTL